jgi:hypothetical protein
MKMCPIEKDPRHKCSIPDDTKLTKEEKLLECQECYVWKNTYEEHQEDVL